MKAVIFREHGGPEKLLYTDVPEPTLGPQDALVRVKACALNHLDIWVRQGIPAYRITLPHISGSDVAGEIAKLGAETGSTSAPTGGVPLARSLSVGARVLIAPGLSCFRCDWCLAGHDNLCEQYRILGAGSDGGYAQFVKVPALNLIPIPGQLSFEEAAAFPLVFLSAWHMLITRARLQPGHSVLVVGAGGGVGTAAIQIAKLAGARVLAAATTEVKLGKAKQLGADAGILVTEKDWPTQVRRLTDQRGVDVVFEHVGPATWAGSLACLAKHGVLVTCGATTGPEVPLDLRFVFSRQLAILGSMMGTRRELLTIAELVGQRKLIPAIDSTFPLSEAHTAQEKLLRREHFGKILLRP
ncbi:MAG: zinc-binding dehydrogenase [Elusimicrobia bacterium]|nr:zinc-binding dehydrogenase [Elusimicrobiota bacterium]